MSMETTPRWALPLLLAGQAQKELFHNEALVRIDALLHGRAESADLVSPPAAPVIGRCWIVAAGATGAWSGEEGKIACWSEGGWRFIAPQAGAWLVIMDRGHELRHDGVEWRDAPVRADGLYLNEEKVIGPRQGAIADPAGGAVIDVEARNTLLAVLDALRGHGLIYS
ncbi:DUF2793 domain-containing protein [Sphingobium sp. BYY-5]|uniref:DUF2793 domain-containing protein n=1 Tax=Sphingobium sp. BYY-5 TaxID=2926400 RepID=UPI001FA76CFC|nr:DUF2793 domain-containing protein [Sphingobium sp. BYY-5]MCI4589836.1 DUF2793 domain-containing protein [Sphingobium sp. BYY-5]